MVWSLAGLILALIVATAAGWCSRSPGGFYAGEIYGMDRRAHLRYAAVSLVFALYFATTYILALTAAGIAGLALYALIAVLYAASFLQGAPDE